MRVYLPWMLLTQNAFPCTMWWSKEEVVWNERIYLCVCVFSSDALAYKSQQCHKRSPQTTSINSLFQSSLLFTQNSRGFSSWAGILPSFFYFLIVFVLMYIYVFCFYKKEAKKKTKRINKSKLSQCIIQKDYIHMIHLFWCMFLNQIANFIWVNIRLRYVQYVHLK